MDQIEIQLPKTKVLEETTFNAEAYFRTRSTSAASAPTTVHYRVDCLSTKRQLLDWTSIATAANVTLPMTSTINEIQDNNSYSEIRQITVKADDGLSTQTIGKTLYRVQNLEGIS